MACEGSFGADRQTHRPTKVTLAAHARQGLNMYTLFLPLVFHFSAFTAFVHAAVHYNIVTWKLGSREM